MTQESQEERWRKEADEQNPQHAKAFRGSWNKGYLAGRRASQAELEEVRKERDQLIEDCRWILVSERLPEPRVKVHIWDGYALQKGHFVKQDEFGLVWHFQGNELCHYGRAVSWRPLPSPPKT